MGVEATKKSKGLLKDDKTIINLIEKAYKDTELELTSKELTSLKLKLKDAENYFFCTFNYLFFFNYDLFNENVSVLYDNFNRVIEGFCKKREEGTFHLLISIEDESELIELGGKVEFEPLFAIIFEKLEIDIVTYIDFTFNRISYIREFFTQLCDNSCLYKCNRKFDCMYFLLPNTDYIIKNGNNICYLATKTNFNYDKCRDIFDKCINVKHFKKYLMSGYDLTNGNNLLYEFVNKISPKLIFTLMYIDFACEVDEFFFKNELQLKTIEKIIQSSKKNVILMLISGNENIEKVLTIFINKIISIFDTTERHKNELKIKILFPNEIGEFVYINFSKTIDEIILGHFEKNFRNYSKTNFIFEFHEIMQKKHSMCDFISTSIKFQFGIGELLRQTNVKSRYKKERKLKELLRPIKDFKKEVYLNPKLMDEIKEFASEKKIVVFDEEKFHKKINNEVSYQKVTKRGKAYFKTFKKYFVRML